MSSATTRGAHFLAAVVVGLLAIPIVAALVWGTWRLVFWGVVDASPHVRGVHPGGLPVPDTMPPGMGSTLTGGVVGVGPAALLGLVALAVAVTVLTAIHSPRDD